MHVGKYFFIKVNLGGDKEVEEKVGYKKQVGI